MATLPAKAVVKAATDELERLLAMPQTKRVLGQARAAADELERLLAKPFKGSKPKPQKPRKLEPPAASKPEPTLKQEPAPAPGAKPATKRKTAPSLRTTPDKKTKEDTRPKGVITMKNVDAIVRQVLDGISFRKVLAYVPGGQEAVFIKDTLSGALSDSDKIIDICQNYVLKQNNKRQRERLAVPGKYPNGTKKIDIMRRMKGAGYAGTPRPRKTKNRPTAVPADKVPGSEPKPTDKTLEDVFPGAETKGAKDAAKWLREHPASKR